jgi:hypothetical protein
MASPIEDASTETGDAHYIARELFPHINNVITPTAIEPAPTDQQIAA